MLGQGTRVLEGLLRESRDSIWLVRDGRPEGVVDDLNIVVLSIQLSDLVGDSLSLHEGRNVLSNIAEAQLDVLSAGPRKLSLDLLSQNHNINIRVLGKPPPGSFGQLRVNTTAKTLIGGGDNEEGLAGLEGLGLGLFENGVGVLTIGTGVTHCLLSTGKLGRGNNLHGSGNLLDVLDGLETALNFSEGGIVVTQSGPVMTKLTQAS